MSVSTIMTVEDNAINLKLLKKIIEKSGHRVIQAMNGDDAIKTALKEQPDLIMLDVMMPGKDGFEVCKILKQNEKTKYIPIIFLTAKNEPVDKVRGLELGANDYITKPFETVEISARIDTHLRLKNLTQELFIKNEQLANAFTDLHEKNEKINKDIKAAGMVQRRLVPQELRNIGPVHFSGRLIPSSHVAGDIFNYMQIDENNIALFIIDVSGHGVQSAMLAVQVYYFLRIGADLKFLKDGLNPDIKHSIYEPDQVALALNSTFTMDILDAYFTAIYMTINLETLKAKFINAGHPYPILIKSDKEFEFIEHADIPIGMLNDSNYQAGEIQFKKGDKFILFTDGLFEIPVSGNDTLKTKNIAEFLLEKNDNLQEGMDYLINKILSLSTLEEFDDDVSLFGIEFK